jgi:hypothetical protein
MTKESQFTERKPLQSEIEKLKTLMMQVDNDRSELQANYDRDSVLWEGKVKFLEEQRDQAK